MSDRPCNRISYLRLKTRFGDRLTIRNDPSRAFPGGVAYEVEGLDGGGWWAVLPEESECAACGGSCEC